MLDARVSRKRPPEDDSPIAPPSATEIGENDAIYPLRVPRKPIKIGYRGSRLLVIVPTTISVSLLIFGLNTMDRYGMGPKYPVILIPIAATFILLIYLMAKLYKGWALLAIAALFLIYALGFNGASHGSGFVFFELVTVAMIILAIIVIPRHRP
jgi:hypothetical protein